MNRRTLPLWLFFSAALPALAAEQKKIAVLEFDSQLGPEEKVDRTYFADQVREVVRRTLPGVFIMTRESTEELLHAYGKTLADCVGSCEVQTGKLLQADLVISGRLTRVGVRYKLSMRLHQTRDGALIGSATASGSSVEQLDDSVQSATEDLLAELVPAGDAPRRPASGNGPATILIVQSDPPAAIVSVDGRVRGPAPLALEDLRPGRHRLQGRLENHSDVEETVEVLAGQTVRSTLTLPLLRGRISISSTADVECEVDGKRTRVSAGSVEVVDAHVGEPKVSCSGKSVEPVVRTVEVFAGKLAELSVDPTPLAADVTIDVQKPDSARWEVRTGKGVEVCELPCEVKVNRKSSLVLRRIVSRTDQSTDEIDLPNDPPFPPGSTARVSYRRGKGSVAVGVLNVAGNLALIGGSVAVFVALANSPSCLSGTQDFDTCNSGHQGLAALGTAGFIGAIFWSIWTYLYIANDIERPRFDYDLISGPRASAKGLDVHLSLGLGRAGASLQF